MVAGRDIGAALRSEEGFGVVEMVTAAILVGIGLVGALAAFDGANHATFTAQRHEQAIAYAERETERLKAHPYELLELDPPRPVPNTSPDDPNNPSDPLAYVEDTDADGAGDHLLILSDYYDRASGEPQGNLEREPLVMDGDVDPAADGVSIDPVEEDVVIGAPTAELPPGTAETTGTVYRFVTDACHMLGTGECDGSTGARRVTVAVALDEAASGAGPRTPVYVSTVVTRDPPEGDLP